MPRQADITDASDPGPLAATGIPGLDDILNGGLARGRLYLVEGIPGSGKTTLSMQFLIEGVRHGEQVLYVTLSETKDELMAVAQVESGMIELVQIDPAELSPGELAHLVRRAVEADGAKIVVIDSLNGYLNAMPEERFLIIQLHELLMYLSQQGVATLLISAHHGIIGAMQGPIDASYLADAVVLMRYFEWRGEVRQAISVVKKRGGLHERTIREFSMSDGSIRVGEALRDFRGVLSGVPVYEGAADPWGQAEGRR